MRRPLPALMVTLLALLGPAAGLFLTEASKADHGWPSFRGPLGNGLAPDADPPHEWSEGSNVRWKVELPGEGHSTPIVWGDRVYLTVAIKKEAPAAPPVEAPAGRADPHGSGAVAQARFAQEDPQPGSPPESPPGPPGGAPPGPPEPPGPEGPQRRGPRAPRPAPTVTHDFAVMALDRATGKTIWKTTVAEQVPHEAGHETASQASASPLTDGERIYAFFGSRGLHCLDMKGAVLWSRDFGDMRTRNQFGEGASPALHGDTLLVNWDHEGEDFIAALDKRTGRERWRTARDEPTSWTTPYVVEDGGRTLAVVSATNRVRAYDVATGAEAWSVGGLGLNCIPTPVAAGGLLYVMSGYQNPAGLAIRYPGAEGDIGGERIAWKVDRGTSYVASPLLYDGKLYFLDRLRAALSRVDLATGQAHYSEQRLEGLGNVYGSPAGAAGRVYIVDRAGNAVVVKHGDAFEVIGWGKLDDGFDASPVIAGDALFLRGHRHFYCIGRS
ncbi:MAG TPA: PQQ-binding-like beta-propeller repeat protein [Candidatus Polarisedimenticolia bacterium]|nr:PQQ-binding-like beta-propeller repeat protein [Candidatus Polarisedimenticolia bacterium]